MGERDCGRTARWLRLSLRFHLREERSFRPAYYAAAFVFSCQIAMLFTELRSPGGLFIHQMVRR
jgi:hypothetical protein